MAKEAEKAQVAKKEDTKVSLKDKIGNSKAVKVCKANWKPFAVGFGSATGIGLLGWILWKVFGVRPAANQDLDIYDLPSEEDPYLSDVTSFDDATDAPTEE